MVRPLRVLLLFLPVAFLICVGTFFMYQKERQLLRDHHSDQAQKDIAVGIASIKRTLQTVHRDLQYLTDRHVNQQLIDSPDSSHLSRLAEDWVAFSQAKQVYDKIRWIDESGMERLRVDYDSMQPVNIPRENLQDKSDRYFFIETFRLGRGQAFISPFDLNMEEGKIEVPFKPTIRIGMPVFDSQGQRRGINLINYSASHLIERIRHVTKENEYAVWLVNREGYWLKGPSPDDEFGFMFGLDDLTMARRYPAEWQRIASASDGQFETDAGLWTFGTVYPLMDDTQDASESAPAGSAGIRQYYWKTVSFLPAERYSAGLAALRIKMGATAFLLLGLFLLACERIVRAREREKHLLADLSVKEERLSTLVETIPEMLWLKDGAGAYVSCNPAIERFFGLPRDKILGKSDHDLVSRELADEVRAQDVSVAAAGKEMTYESWQEVPCSGQRILLEITKVPVRTPDGELVGVLGIGRDITERKRIESQLRDSHDLLVNLAAQVPGMIYQFRLHPNGHTSMPFVSESIKTLYGIAPDQVREDASALFGFCHPDDLPALVGSMQESARTMLPWRCEFRTVTENREIRWRRGDARPQKLEDGSTLWHGHVSDITELKLTEEELRLAATVYRHSDEAMMITDAGNLIIAVNPAFEEITGYAAEEVIGKSPRMLGAGRHGKVFYQQIVRDLDTTGHWEGELWKRRKNGEVYATRCRVNAIFLQDGSLHRRVALFSDITLRKKNEELIWQHANFDQLTGLPNRRMFLERLRHEVGKTGRSGDSLALLFIDLDNFKDINDTLGHDRGDILLKDAASRLKSCVRETDMVARLGGDEFTVLLGQLGPTVSVERVVGDILRQLSEPFRLGDEFAYVSASIGVTFYPQDASAVEDMVKNADQAMYAAKQLGRNRCHYFTPSMQAAAQNRMRLVNDMRQAIASNQFCLAYQPIVELATGSIHKAEALIRWQHPERGLIGPSEFIRTAEDTGMILIIGDWVFRAAARQAARWRTLHDPLFQVSVNVSPAQFRNEGIDLAAWISHLRKAGLTSEGVVVEITESLLLEASDSVKGQLLDFRNAGIEVALDDFGTGYSSLSYLKRFDIDYLKIDQSFVRNLGAGSDDMALCEAIIVMAHRLGIKVIAEGVETSQQRDILFAAGCDYGQGYYFSAPVTEAELERMLDGQSAAVKRLATG